MAHIVQLPLSFEFRTVTVKWRERKSSIVGLSWDDIGGWELKARVIGSGRKVEANLSLEDVPPELWKQCSDAVDAGREDGFDYLDDTIGRICSDFQPRLLVASEEDLVGEYSLPADAWQLRDDFLRVGSDVSNILAFLNRWGRWSKGRWSTDEYTLLHRIVRFQQDIRRALVASPDEWLSDELNPYLDLDSYVDTDRKSVYPYFSIDTFECKSAICKTVTIDLLRKVKFDTCARQDCGQPFPIMSRHKRKFCSQYCGHLESVRRGRARTRLHVAKPSVETHYRLATHSFSGLSGSD